MVDYRIVKGNTMERYSNALALAASLEANTTPIAFSMHRFYNKQNNTACIAGLAILMFGTGEDWALLEDYATSKCKMYEFKRIVEDIERAALRILGPAFNRESFYNVKIHNQNDAAAFIRHLVVEYELNDLEKIVDNSEFAETVNRLVNDLVKKEK